MKKSRIVPVVAVALSMMVAAPTVSADLPDGQVPLLGRFDGVGAEFAGNFTHLGAFTGVVDLDPSGGIDPTVWVAANGDTVTNLTTSFVPAPDGSYVQTIVITGGTGRFEGATGSATITGDFDFGTFAYDGSIVGTISRPGPNR